MPLARVLTGKIRRREDRRPGGVIACQWSVGNGPVCAKAATQKGAIEAGVHRKKMRG